MIAAATTARTPSKHVVTGATSGYFGRGSAASDARGGAQGVVSLLALKVVR